MRLRTLTAAGLKKLPILSKPNSYFAVTPSCGGGKDNFEIYVDSYALIHVHTGLAVCWHVGKDDAEKIAAQIVRIKLPWRAKKKDTILTAYHKLPLKQRKQILQMREGIPLKKGIFV